jgi:hypothetical protein
VEDFNRYIKEAEELLLFAYNEFKEAKRERDELLARQVCEKAYLALIKGFDALFLKRGKRIEELPQGERGRRYFLHTLAGKELEDLYESLRAKLHIDGFHEGIIIFEDVEEDLNEIERFIDELKDERR